MLRSVVQVHPSPPVKSKAYDLCRPFFISSPDKWRSFGALSDNKLQRPWPVSERRAVRLECLTSSANRSRKAVIANVGDPMTASDPLLPLNSETSGVNAATEAGVCNRHRDLSEVWRHAAGHCLHARRLHSGTRDGVPQVLFSAKLKVAPASLPALKSRC
jgi:hypothetical protein